MKKFEVVESTVLIEGKHTRTLGISCGQYSVFDITSDFDQISTLVNICNDQDVSPLHIKDIVEDLIVSY